MSPNVSPEYDIIIPHHSVRDTDLFLARCLQSIRSHSRDYHVILINNGRSEAVRTAADGIPATIIDNQENLGFVKAVNQGIRLSTAPYVVVMNNDTEAAPGWLGKLRAALVGTVGISGPRTTTRESWQGTWEGRTGTIVLPKSAMLAFFCAMFRAELFDKVGLLDEGYGVGLGDDDDYCRRAHRAGYDLALVQDLVIPHHHRTTFRKLFSQEQIAAMQQEAMKRFKQG